MDGSDNITLDAENGTQPRTCTRCHQPQPLENFYRKTATRLDTFCIPCRRSLRNARYKHAKTSPSAPTIQSTAITAAPQPIPRVNPEDFALLVSWFQTLADQRDKLKAKYRKVPTGQPSNSGILVSDQRVSSDSEASDYVHKAMEK